MRPENGKTPQPVLIIPDVGQQILNISPECKMLKENIASNRTQ